MSDYKLIAELRTEFGKGAARRIRRADKIPAVMYGHGTEPRHIILPGHETMLAFKHSNPLLEIESVDGTKNELAIAKDVQRHPVNRTIDHVDLIIVKRGEKIEIEVPIVIAGEAVPGTLVSLETQSLLVLADATKLPDAIEANIEGRGVNEHLLASDLLLPNGVELVADPETLMVHIAAMLSEAQLEAELESSAVEEVAPETETESAEAGDDQN